MLNLKLLTESSFDVFGCWILTKVKKVVKYLDISQSFTSLHSILYLFA